MSLRHVDLDRRTVFQDARDVRTKNRKTFTSTFFPVGEDIEAIVAEWTCFLTREKLFGPDDPLFPATRIEVGAVSRHFEVTGLERKGWGNTSAIRRIFRQAFEAAGLPYFDPHCFRNTLATLGEKLCTTGETFKAWSQNLAHENVLTTFISYGAVARDRQADILNGLRRKGGAKGASAGEPTKPFNRSSPICRRRRSDMMARVLKKPLAMLTGTRLRQKWADVTDRGLFLAANCSTLKDPSGKICWYICWYNFIFHNLLYYISAF